MQGFIVFSLSAQSRSSSHLSVPPGGQVGYQSRGMQEMQLRVHINEIFGERSDVPTSFAMFNDCFTVESRGGPRYSGRQ